MPKSPPVLDEDTLIMRCNYLFQIGILRAESRVDPKRWLSNFPKGSEQRQYAVNLLGAFLYLPRSVFEAMFVAGMHALSAQIATPPLRRDSWNSFLDKMVVVPVQPVRDNPTSSGLAYARLAKLALKVPEDQIKYALEAAQLVTHDQLQPVVFVDDFVGTGEQFLETWTKNHYVPGPEPHATSFEALSAQGHGHYYYCPVVASHSGMKHIAEKAPAVHLSPGNVLSERHSAFHPESVLWPEPLRDGAEQFLREASLAVGIPDDPASTKFWKGYKGQGLAVGFEGDPPDATLPIFTWEENEWKPFLQATS